MDRMGLDAGRLSSGIGRSKNKFAFLAAALTPLSEQPRYTRRMDRLWTPWRYSYITRADPQARTGVPAALNAWPPSEAEDKHCVFCNMIAAVDYAIAHGMRARPPNRRLTSSIAVCTALSASTRIPTPLAT